MKKFLMYGEIGWEVTAKETVAWLEENAEEEIEMHINSPGGGVFEAIAIRGAILTCPNITIVVDSLAASAAAIISLCGKPLKMSAYSRLMLHSASTLASGNSKEMEEQVENLKSIDADLASMIAGKIGKSQEEVAETYFDGKDHWLTQEECVAMGIAEAYGEGKTEDRAVAVYDCVNGHWKDCINHLTNKDMNIEKIQALEAFRDCATEDEVVEKAAEQAQSLEELQRQSEEKDKRITELEAEVKAFREKEAKAQEEADEAKISDAIKEGRLPEEQADAFRALMKSDRDNTIRLIDTLKAPAKQADVRDYMKGEGDMPKKSYFKEEMEKIANQSK